MPYLFNYKLMKKFFKRTAYIVAGGAIIGMAMKISYQKGYIADLKRENARKDWLLIKAAKKSGYDFAKKGSS